MTNKQINDEMEKIKNEFGTSSFAYRQYINLLSTAGVKLKNGKIEKGARISKTVRKKLESVETLSDWKRKVISRNEDATKENIQKAIEVNEYFQTLQDFYYDVIENDLKKLHEKNEKLSYSELYELMKKMKSADEILKSSLFDDVLSEFDNNDF